MPSIQPYDEKTLQALIASGNRQAFAQFYELHIQHLYRYIFLFTRSKQDAEEILQDIFIKIWEQREKLPHIASAREYLFKMAKNKLLDNIRHQQIRHRVQMELRRTNEFAAGTTADQCAYKEYYQVVQQAIEKLPPKRKLIFRLNIENGLSQEEIATQLHISKSVVQKQLYSATHFVRQYLFEHSEISVPLLISVVACTVSP